MLPWQKSAEREKRQKEVLLFTARVLLYETRVKKIEEHNREAYLSYGDDCQGSLDWIPAQSKWQEEERRKIDAIAQELNLSKKEMEYVRDKVNRALCGKDRSIK